MKLRGISPDAVSWLALVFAVLTGYAFYTGKSEFLLLASAFVFLSGFFDALDGALARVSKLASKRGDLLDHVLDRYADIFIIGGASIYAQALPFAQKMILSHIKKEYEGDTYFPSFNKEDWEVESEKDFPDFILTTYLKKTKTLGEN